MTARGSRQPTSPSAASSRVDIGFAWALKRSFVEYIAGMRDGRMSLEGEAALTSTQEFYFPFRSTQRGNGDWVSSFSGGLRFVAHHGLLSVAIRNPQLRVAGEFGSLLIDGPDGRVEIAHLTMTEPTRDGDVLMWRCDDVRLSPSAVELFGGSYDAGEPLAPITARVPINEPSSSTGSERRLGDGQ